MLGIGALQNRSAAARSAHEDVCMLLPGTAVSSSQNAVASASMADANTPAKTHRNLTKSYSF